MGVVYRALDPALGRTVALKTVTLAFAVPDPAEREVFEKRFLLEVPPGRNTLRVQVRWEDNTKTDFVSGTLQPGEDNSVVSVLS